MSAFARGSAARRPALDRQCIRGIVAADRRERTSAAARSSWQRAARSIRPPWIESARAWLSCGWRHFRRLETLRIAQIRFGVDELPEPLARLVVDKAEGNALFVEEIVRLFDRTRHRAAYAIGFDLRPRYRGGGVAGERAIVC